MFVLSPVPSPNHVSARTAAADNVAEREEQVAAITARAMRVRPSTASRSFPAFGETPAAEPPAVVLPPPFVDSTPQVSAGVIMQPWEAQAKASIAAALIVRGAVEVPSIPPLGKLPDDVGLRLRELTEYIYRLVTMEIPEP